jgi:hypothetical protein
MQAEHQKLIDVATATFPETFGLRAFPGKTFRISKGASYVVDEPQLRVVLYVYVLGDDGRWLAFAKGTPEELRPEVRPDPSA